MKWRGFLALPCLFWLAVCCHLAEVFFGCLNPLQSHQNLETAKADDEYKGECSCSARKMPVSHGVKSTDISGTVACGMLSAVGTCCHSPKSEKHIICFHALPSGRASDTKQVYQHCLTWDWRGEVEVLSVLYLDLIRRRCSTQAPAEQLWAGTVCAASKKSRQSCTCMQRDAGWAGA